MKILRTVRLRSKFTGSLKKSINWFKPINLFLRKKISLNLKFSVSKGNESELIGLNSVKTQARSGDIPLRFSACFTLYIS